MRASVNNELQSVMTITAGYHRHEQKHVLESLTVQPTFNEIIIF